MKVILDLIEDGKCVVLEELARFVEIKNREL